MLTVKELPDTERPYEKCMHKGAEYLSDAELIAVILRTGTNGTQSIQLAQEIISPNQKGLQNLYDLNLQELMKIKGVGPVKAVQLKCIAELSKRISCMQTKDQIIMTDACSVAGYYMERMRHEPTEVIMVSYFTGKGQLLADKKIAIGSLDSSIVSPREVFREAIVQNAAYFILLHNHPSGDPIPSQNDRDVTHTLMECGKYMSIYLADHIVIGDNRYYSFRENRLL